VLINSGKDCVFENINIFNDLMINTVKSKDDKFQFEGNQYLVSSDGVCVQTLINDRVLYRIFMDKK